MTDDKALVKKIAVRLRKARKVAGLTQVEVAEKAGISINHYAQIERGEVNPSASKLLQIIKAVGVSSEEILGK